LYAALPNLASAHEQGLADFEAPTWFAVFLPRGASEPIIRKLNQAAFATADTPSAPARACSDEIDAPAGVIAGLDPAISMPRARPCHVHRDGRDKPGHDDSE
jgi:Tripartite tricarboxylate transporter family receptor